MSSVSFSSDYSSFDGVSTISPTSVKGDVRTADVERTGVGINDTVFLMVVASVGMTLNALVAASLLTMPETGHFRAAYSFVIHACLLDGIKCVYCVPFAASSLQGVDPSVCDALSRFVYIMHIRYWL